MRYVEAKLTEKTQALMYRIYVTDTLHALVNNTSKVGGISISKRFYDVFKESFEPKKAETRTKEEIIEHIRSGLDKLREQP